MSFGDNVPHPGSRQKNVACFFAVSCVRCLLLSVFASSSGMTFGSGMPFGCGVL